MENLFYDESKENPRYQLIDGKTVMFARPRISHATIAGNIYGKIWGYLKGKRCKIFFEPEVWLDENNHLIPDLAVVCNRDLIKTTRIEGAPDLVVEVLSRKTARDDRGKKKDAYERSGVKEYWIVDADSKSIEVYHLQEGKLQIDGVFSVYPEDELAEMDEKDKGEILMHFKVSLYDDLVIDINEVFEDS